MEVQTKQGNSKKKLVSEADSIVDIAKNDTILYLKLSSKNDEDLNYEGRTK